MFTENEAYKAVRTDKGEGIYHTPAEQMMIARRMVHVNVHSGYPVDSAADFIEETKNGYNGWYRFCVEAVTGEAFHPDA